MASIYCKKEHASTIFRWMQLQTSTIDLWSDLKLIRAVHSITATLRKGAGLPRGKVWRPCEKEENQAVICNTGVSQFAFISFFFATFPHSSLHTAAVLDSGPTACISAGRIKDRNAAAFHKTYYRRTRRPYWISAIDWTLQQGGGAGCIRTVLSNNK